MNKDASEAREEISYEVKALLKDVEYIKEMLKDLKLFFIDNKNENERKFVTHEHMLVVKTGLENKLITLEEKFKPVKLIAYGIAYGTMGLVLVALLSSILKQQ